MKKFLFILILSCSSFLSVQAQTQQEFDDEFSTVLERFEDFANSATDQNFNILQSQIVAMATNLDIDENEFVEFNSKFCCGCIISPTYCLLAECVSSCLEAFIRCRRLLGEHNACTNWLRNCLQDCVNSAKPKPGPVSTSILRTYDFDTEMTKFLEDYVNAITIGTDAAWNALINSSILFMQRAYPNGFDHTDFEEKAGKFAPGLGTLGACLYNCAVNYLICLGECGYTYNCGYTCGQGQQICNSNCTTLQRTKRE
jgi:hypothetical protein